MSSFKNFNTTYTLNGPSVIVTGNLLVLGNNSQVNSNVTTITDNFITLNAGETGPGVSLLGTTSGIIIDRGSRANVKLQWQEGPNVWQISDSTGANFANINSGGLAGDPNPTLSANLNTWNSAITSNIGSVVFGSNIQLDNTITTPVSAITNATIIYAAPPAGGTSGVYVLNGQAANQELVTKARAFGFSLLL